MVETLALTTPDGTAEAFLAPADGTPKGGVVLFMDAIGLRPRIADMAEHIASWGYTVLAPNVFHRWGSVEELRPHEDITTPEARERFFADGRVMRNVGALTSDLLREDNPIWLERLRAEVGATAPVGVTGYCFGGRLATRFAAQFPDEVAAVGGWHTGGMVNDQPDSPHLSIAQAKAEFFFGWADNDSSMPPESIAVVEEALEAAGLVYTSEVFEGSKHGYTMKDSAPYGEVHEQRHWRELEALLGRTLV